MAFMLSDSQQALLLDAVPSFEAKWRQWLADRAEYEARFPESAHTSEKRERELLFHLSWHVGERVARGDLGEVVWLFAALDQIYREADDELDSLLTIHFLEGLIHAIEEKGTRASVLHAIPMGEQVRGGWNAAYAYTHHGETVDETNASTVPSTE
jgi:hypothetical protein